MVDDHLIESLSRYLDGDLDPAEAHEMRTLLESDRALQMELSGLQDLRGSLGQLADREHPPATLDALVEPLLQARSSSVAVRPWAMWFATAAVVVLGATIVFEVNRRDMRTGSETKSIRAQEAHQNAQPLPQQMAEETPQPAPKGERPRGAVDRLIASPDPEVDPLDEDPPALEVIGPLSVAAEGTRGPQFQTSGKRGRIVSSAPAPELRKTTEGVFDGDPEKPAGTTSANEQSVSENPPEGMEIDRPTTRAKLYVFMEEKTAWLGFEPSIRCESGRYALRLRVADGVVMEVWPVGRPPAAPSRHLRAGEIILGLEVSEVPDGEYSAQVTIEPRSNPRR